MSLGLQTTAWRNGERIPTRHTADGPDLSPAFEFTGAPPGTVAFALICDDPDAPVGTWVHWVLYDIPGTASGLPEGIAAEAELPDGSRHGKNSWKNYGYGGPSPPPGKPHRYYFRLYALREPLGAEPGLTASRAESLARERAIESAQYLGTYGRP